MFEVLIREIGQRFGLGSRAEGLVGLLLGIIFSPDHGGFQGFIQRLRAAGLSPQADAWQGRGENAPMPGGSVTAVLGQPVLAKLCANMQQPPDRLLPALAALIPSLIDKLTPDGVLPKPNEIPETARAPIDAVRAELAPYLALLPAVTSMPTSAAPIEPLSRPVSRPTATPAPAPRDSHSHASKADAHHDQHASVSEHGGVGRWLSWAAALMIAVTGYFWFRNIEFATAPASPDKVSSASFSELDPDRLQNSGFQEGGKPAPLPSAALQIEVAQGRISARGELSSQAQIDALRAAAEQTFGASAIQLELRTARGVASEWLPALVSLLPELKAQTLALDFTSVGIGLSGLDPAANTTLVASMRAAFAGFELNGFSADPAVRALEALRPEQGVETASLVSALNLMVVYFETGKAEIKPGSMDVLREAANVLRRLPPERRLEVGGHTDNRGEAAGNQVLSEQRAAAVMNALVEFGAAPSMLQAKGYGAAEPMADNSTKAGRAQNRRMAFKALTP